MAIEEIIAEVGHHVGRAFLGQDGHVHLNGASLVNGLTGTPAQSASGLIMGLGTTAAPAETDEADAKFIEYRCKSNAPSGDNRLLYLRYDLDGGGGGECIRAFTELGADVGTARGAHVSLEVSSTANCSGLGVGVDAQINIEAGALDQGTYAAVNAEIYSGDATSDPGGQAIACYRAVNNGNATGKADVDDDAAILAVDGFTAATGTAHAVSSTSLNELPASSIGLRITVDGAVYYIPAVIAAEWN